MMRQGVVVRNFTGYLILSLSLSEPIYALAMLPWFAPRAMRRQYEHAMQAHTCEDRSVLGKWERGIHEAERSRFASKERCARQ